MPRARNARLRLTPLEGRLAPAAGSLDPAFGENGFVALHGLASVDAVAVMQDGRVVAAGLPAGLNSNPAPDAEFAVARLTVEGKLDPTFGMNGLALIDIVPQNGTNNALTAITLRPDGGVVVVGRVGTGAAVAALTPAGQLDPTFKTDGKIVFAWPNGTGNSTATAARALSDGSVVVAGTRAIGPNSARPFPDTVAAAAVRFRSDGSFDPGYGRGGFADGPADVAVPDAGVMPDGGAVFLYTRLSPPLTAANGSFTFAVARLSPAGTPDAGFGAGGSADVFTRDLTGYTGSSNNTYDAHLAAFSDGRLFAWLRSTGNSRLGPAFGLADATRVLADGAADPTYLGTTPSGQPSLSSRVAYTDVDALPDGRMLATYTDFSGINGSLLRTTADGGRDPGFVVTQTDSTFPRVQYGAVAATPDGGAVTAGFHQAEQNVDLIPGVTRILGDAPIPAITGLRGVTAVGPGPGGGPNVSFLTATGADAGGLQPFGAAYSAGLRVATADFNSDGTDDLVAGTGPGGAAQVRVLDGRTRRILFDLAPFEAAFTGGVYVAAGDTNGDGVPELVVTPDEGGGPRVRVFDGKAFTVLADFFGIDDPDFRGGARAAVGDVDGDGAGDLVVAAGFQGGPRVAGFGGRSLASGSPAHVFPDFFAFEQTLRNGVFIAAGDIDGDGKAEVIAGGGPGGGPRVTAFSGSGLLGGQFNPVANFFGGEPANRGGIRVAVKNLDGDNRADPVVGSGDGAGSRTTAYLGANIPIAGTPPTAFDFDAFPGFTGGVFVG